MPNPRQFTSLDYADADLYGALNQRPPTSTRVISGQPVGQAAGSALTTAGLSTAGWVLGAAFGGPVGGAVGAIAGSWIAGKLNELLFPNPKPAILQPQSEPVQGIVNFSGGQITGALYTVNATVDVYDNGTFSYVGTGNINNVRGKIQEVGITPTTQSPNSAGFYVIGTNIDGSQQFKEYGFASPVTRYSCRNLRNITIQRSDGLPDVAGNPAPKIPDDFRTPNSISHPGNQEYGVPSALPDARQSARPQPNNYAPGGTTINASPRGDSLGWVPHGSLALNDLGSKLDALNLGANAAQLALLQTIDNKIGAQLPGGIAGKLSRFTDWLKLDRALNLLILASTIHNALMLSNNIGQTLLGAINNGLQLIGLKGEDGQAFDLGAVISGTVENIVKGIIGIDNYTELKTAWAKANRIYQATTNILNAFQGLSSAILTGLEMTAGKVAKLGNALRQAGEVLESAYGWMNPQPKFNRVTQTLENLQNGASTIQIVTQAPLDVVNAVTELTTANTEFVKAIKEDDKPENKGKESPEPDKLKTDKAIEKTASAGKEITDVDLDPDD